jgi:glyoxalase family protein
MPDAPIPGLHHITAISGAAQETLDFYARTLGLRLVKTTVNFDDPGTYHLYFGDRTGQPGTILTFFPWAHAVLGRAGLGMAAEVAFAAPTGSLGFWRERLDAHDVEATEAAVFGDDVLRLAAPDGLALALVATDVHDAGTAWTEGPVPAEHALAGFFGTTLDVADADPVADLLTGAFGWTEVEAETTEGGGERMRFAAPEPAVGRVIDLRRPAEPRRARSGKGTIHHIALRARDDDEQLAWREALAERGIGVTEVKDRQYFRSIYFRHADTGGVLFEIATDAPGFAADEPVETLGEALKLPPWLEGRRDELERRLPALERPARDA